MTVEGTPSRRRWRPVLGLIVMLLVLHAGPALAQDDETPVEASSASDASDDDAGGGDEESRRRRLARLGSDKVRLPPPTGEVYPLEALLERGMEVNPLMVARRHAELFAQYRTEEAAWARAPKFDITTTITAVPNKTDFNEVQSNLTRYLNLDIGPLSATSIRLAVPIYSFGKLSIAAELADLGVEQAELETREERLKLLTQIREAYYAYQLGKHIQAIMKDVVELMREEIERQDEAREFGDENVDIEALRKLQIFETELSEKVIDNQRLIDLSKAALATLVLMERDQFDVPPFEEEANVEALLPLESYQDTARRHRVDLQLLERAVRARQLQADLEFSEFLPDFFFALDFSVGLSTVEAPNQRGSVIIDDESLPLEVAPLNDPFNFTRLGFLFGLRLKIDPANQYWKLQEAEARLAETRHQRQAAINGVMLDIEKAWAEADSHRQKLDARERRLKAADRWRKQVAIAYQSGGANLDDFMEPLKKYFEARLLVLAAQYDYKVAMARLGRKVGVTDVEALAQEAAAPARKP